LAAARWCSARRLARPTRRCRCDRCGEGEARHDRFCVAGNGTSPHLAGELLKTTAHIDLTHIPYKGSGPALSDVIGGSVPLMFDTMLVVGAQVKAGKLRPLAVASTKRIASLPNVPTVAEAGFPGFEVVSWQAIFAPAGTPKPIVQRLNTEIAKVLKMPDVKAKVDDLGVDPAAGPPEQLADFRNPRSRSGRRS
jgi:tripartite-type tricarboxylate transporter receptor subunit TctC